MPLTHLELVQMAYEEARLHVAATPRSSEWLRLGSSFRGYCDKAQLNSRQVLAEVRAQMKAKAKKESFAVLGQLYKDWKGRRCWLVAQNPGREAMFFVEGQRLEYVTIAEKGVRALYTRYSPPKVPDAPEWWERYCTGRSRTQAHIEAMRSGGYWNGWYATEINERFYILAGPTIERVFYEVNPLRKNERLFNQPLYV